MMADQTIARVEPVRTEAYLDFLQMLTGVGLVAFMWAHMILVASVNLDLGGGRVMNAIAHFFEATYMAQIGGPMIALTMLVHFVLAARKLPFRAREQKAMWRHSRQFQPHRYLAVDNPGGNRFHYSDHGVHPHVDGAHQSADNRRKERRQGSGRMVACLLPCPAPDDRASRRDRNLQNRRKVGIYQEV